MLKSAKLPVFYGWIVVAIAFVTMGIGVNTRTVFSLLFPPILDEFGWERAAVAATFSIGFIAATLLVPLIGAMMDRYGPRITIPVGAVITAAGLVLATYARLPWHFYLTLGVMVVGGSIFMAYIGHGLFLYNWFHRRRGLALGLAFAGVGFGSITIFPWVQHLIQTQGWRTSNWILAGLLIAVVVPLNAIFQRKHPHDLGLQPDGAHAPVPLKEGERGPVDRAIVDPAWAATDWTLRRAMRTARFWWLVVAFNTGLYAWYAVQIHQTRYLMDAGILPEAAAVALGLVGLFGVVGQIGIGHLSDRVGREWAWTASLLGYLACYVFLLLLQEVPSVWLMYAMVAAQGLLGYGLASVFGAVPAELFGGRRFGVIFGVLAAASNAGAATGPWATGLMFDASGNYAGAWHVAIAMCVISIAAMWLASPRKVRLVGGRIPKD
jgi:MFS family permease